MGDFPRRRIGTHPLMVWPSSSTNVEKPLVVSNPGVGHHKWLLAMGGAGPMDNSKLLGAE